MASVIVRTLVGILLGVFLTPIAREVFALPPEGVYLVFLWCVGTSGGFPTHIRTLYRLIDPSLSVSVISFLTFGSGLLGFMIIVLYVAYCLAFGWIYGLGRLLADIVWLILGDR